MDSPLKQKKISNNKRKSCKQIESLEEELLQQSKYKQKVIDIANAYFPSITVPIPINESIKPKNSTQEVPIQTVDDYICQVCNILPQPTQFDHNQFLFTMQTMVSHQLNYAQEFQQNQEKTKKTTTNNNNNNNNNNENNNNNNNTNQNKSNKSKRVKSQQQSKKDLDVQSMTTINKSDDDSLDQFQSQNPRNLSQLDSMETLDNDQNDCGKFSPQSQKTQQLFDSPLDSPKKSDEIDSYINDLDDYYHQMPLKKKKSCFDDEITEKFLNIPDTLDLNFNDNLNEVY